MPTYAPSRQASHPKVSKSNSSANVEDMSVSPDTLVIFTQKKARLASGRGDIAKVATEFFKVNAERLIAPPIPREDMNERLAELKAIPESINLVLIGHGSDSGSVSVGGRFTKNLNNLKLPSTLTSKVAHVSLMHCDAGQDIQAIGRKTVQGEGSDWSSLKTMSGNLFPNHWSSMGGMSVISRRGWSEDEKNLKPLAQTLLKDKEGAAGRTINDSALKNEIPYNKHTIFSPEGFHRTYDVEKDSAHFSYPVPTRLAAAISQAATGTARDMPAGRGRTPGAGSRPSTTRSQTAGPTQVERPFR